MNPALFASHPEDLGDGRVITSTSGHDRVPPPSPGTPFRAVVSVVVENGRVIRIYALANPRKLTRLEQPVELARSDFTAKVDP